MASRAETVDLPDDLRQLCDDLASRVGVTARRAVIELVVEDGHTKEVFRKERFAASELSQFDRTEERP